MSIQHYNLNFTRVILYFITSKISLKREHGFGNVDKLQFVCNWHADTCTHKPVTIFTRDWCMVENVYVAHVLPFFFY